MKGENVALDWDTPFEDIQEAFSSEAQEEETPAPKKDFLDSLTSPGALLPPKPEEPKTVEPPKPAPDCPSEELPEALRGTLEACQEEEVQGLRIEPAINFMSTPPAPYDCILEGAFERGDKVEVIAPSKCKKSFWVIGLALHVASGRDFCGMKVKKPRAVLYINLELKPDTLKRRLADLVKAYGLPGIPSPLFVLNARGKGGEVRDCLPALGARFDLVIVDPRYKLIRMGENENTGDGMQAILECFDHVANAGAALLSVGHDAKGFAGDRDARDRGAGSSWTGRDCDCRFTLTPHVQGEDFTVFEGMVRAFPPIKPRTLRIEGNGFFEADDIEPVPETSVTRSKAYAEGEAAKKTAREDEGARKALDAKLEADKVPMLTGEAVDEIMGALTVGKVKARAILTRLLQADRNRAGGITERVERRKGGGKLIGYPPMFAEMDAEITGR